MLFFGLKKVAVGAVVTLATAGALTLSVSPANALPPAHPAGFNGQQVDLCLPSNPSFTGGSARIQGLNQYGQVKSVEGIKLGPNCTPVRNQWWWKGGVTVDWNVPQGRKQTVCDVPVDQKSNNFSCYY